jgi:hypothetical protein
MYVPRCLLLSFSNRLAVSQQYSVGALECVSGCLCVLAPFCEKMMTTAMESIMRSHSRTATRLCRASVGQRVGITGATGCAGASVAGNCSGWAFSPGGRVEDEG